MRERARSLRLLVGLAWRADRRRLLAGLAVTLFGGALAPLAGVWLKLLADGVTAGDERRVAIAAGALGVSWLLGTGAGNLSWSLLEEEPARADRAALQRAPDRAGGGSPASSTTSAASTSTGSRSCASPRS